MMNRLLQLKVFILVVLFFFCTGPINANTTTSSGWSDTNGGWGLTFGSSDVGIQNSGDAFGFFNDDYYFTMPATTHALSGGTLVTSGFGPVAPFLNTVFDHFSIENITKGGTVGEATLSASGDTLATFNFVVAQADLNDVFKLHLDGHMVDTSKTATYSGSIQISPISSVPEPEAYAMFLIGLGLVSVASCRRKSV